VRQEEEEEEEDESGRKQLFVVSILNLLECLVRAPLEPLVWDRSSGTEELLLHAFLYLFCYT
jgi:hypothetical protein